MLRQRVVAAAEDAQAAQLGSRHKEQREFADVIPAGDVTRVTHAQFPRETRTHQRTLLLRQAAASTVRWETSPSRSASTQPDSSSNSLAAVAYTSASADSRLPDRNSTLPSWFLPSNKRRTRWSVGGPSA